MSETLFVSDVHLDVKRPAVVDLFNLFLLKRAIHADALYILGDLFEYWIGDDAPYDEYQSTFQALKTVSESNTPVYFLHGNRDFLVAEKFAKQTGILLLTEEHVANIYNQKILLMHGDTLCIDDIAYQRFRKKTQNKWLRWIVLQLPVSTRQSLAKRLRDTSTQAVAEKSDDIMDVNQIAVEAAMQRNKTNLLIHGHTHRPSIHDFEIDSKFYKRAVLGDWYKKGSVISVSPEGIVLESFTSV
ncbi:MAG: UDP-2,3-diacylglucosamine diphosphatase [Gammaproteobacteria bacterium]|nr:UDP-2,3-diacylglucosamine diphosphatase [Gammaproteobacteria bacterium]